MRRLKGMIEEIRPLPVLATFAALVLAFAMVGSIPVQAPLFFLMAFFLLYTVHFLDTYEDAFVRKEDEHKTFHFAHGSNGRLEKNELLAGAVVSSLIFLVLVFTVAQGTTILFPVVVLLGYWIGVSYSPILSKHLATSLLAHPAGVVLGMVSAFLLVGATNWSELLPLLAPVFLLMLGGKARMDIADQDADAFTKRDNIALLWGEKKARVFSKSVILLGVILALVQMHSVGGKIGLVILSLVFFRGFAMSAKKGIHWIMPAIFLFLVWEILVHMLPIP